MRTSSIERITIAVGCQGTTLRVNNDANCAPVGALPSCVTNTVNAASVVWRLALTSCVSPCQRPGICARPPQEAMLWITGADFLTRGRPKYIARRPRMAVLWSLNITTGDTDQNPVSERPIEDSVFSPAAVTTRALEHFNIRSSSRQTQSH